MKKLFLIFVILSAFLIILNGCTTDNTTPTSQSTFLESKISKAEAELLAKEYVDKWLTIESRDCGGRLCPDFKISTVRIENIQETDIAWLVNVYFDYTYTVRSTDETHSSDDILHLKVYKNNGETHIAEPTTVADRIGTQREDKGQISVKKI